MAFHSYCQCALMSAQLPPAVPALSFLSYHFIGGKLLPVAVSASLGGSAGWLSSTSPAGEGGRLAVGMHGHAGKHV